MTLVARPLVSLQNRVEQTLLSLHLFVGYMLDMGDGLTEGLFRALVFLIHVHFCLPGAQIAFALIENHMKFH